MQRELPRELVKGLMKTERPFEEQKYAMEKALKSNSVPKEDRRKIEQMFKDGSFDRVSQSVNPEVSKKIEDFNSAKIKEGIRSGVLNPKADKSAHNFFRKVKDKFR